MTSLAVNPQATNRYQFLTGQGETQVVHPERAEVAAAIDTDNDHFLSETEVMDYLKRTDALEDPHGHAVDTRQVVSEFQSHLRKEIPATVSGYPSYAELTQELDDLAQAHPELCKKVSIGTTAEGRPIWALVISEGIQNEDTSKKPGLVFTGVTHAREWMSLQPPRRMAHEMLEGYATDAKMQERVRNAETWIIPVANPDGYEYSRSSDNWWRKNRHVVEDTGCGGGANGAVGVDINRNYADGNPDHAYIYRPAGDTPCNTSDDFGWATSDNPRSDTYRGPYGASENETQALLNLELNRGNIKGIIDHHGYGEMILYPWGNTDQTVDNVEVYRKLGTEMNEAMAANGGRFKLQQSCELYPTSGGSHDIHHANGILSITLEIGRSFQPDPKLIEPISKQVVAADYSFMDQVLAMNPPQEPPAPPQQPPAPPQEPPAPPQQPPDEGSGCFFWRS